MEGVGATVDAGAGVKQGWEQAGVVDGHGSKQHFNGGQVVRDGNWDGPAGAWGGDVERAGKGDELNDGVSGPGGLGWPWIGVFKMHPGTASNGGSWWRIDDAALGVSGHRLTIVVESAFVGKVGKVLLEEPFFAAGCVLVRTWFACSILEAEVVAATSVTPFESAGEATLVLDIRVGVNRVDQYTGRGWGLRGVTSENRLGWTQKDTGSSAWGYRDRRC